jgi:hypothetical protein
MGTQTGRLVSTTRPEGQRRQEMANRKSDREKLAEVAAAAVNLLVACNNTKTVPDINSVYLCIMMNSGRLEEAAAHLQNRMPKEVAS